MNVNGGEVPIKGIIWPYGLLQPSTSKIHTIATFSRDRFIIELCHSFRFVKYGNEIKPQ